VSETTDWADWTRSLLLQGDLDAKLAPPSPQVRQSLREVEGERPVHVDRPVRAPGLALAEGRERLPRPRALGDPRARAVCLARFAHHELMAVELFAWALLRWPDAPSALRAEWLQILTDEQRHCRLYLERLGAHGFALTDFAPHSGYFWRQAPAIAASPHGIRAFLAAMGLTLEQANLDFTLLYRDGFRTAGDEASARVCQRVHDDEVRHVRSAARWLPRLDRDAPGSPPSLARAYARAVPFPLSAARAKGRRFDIEARRRAGLDGAFIETVRRAQKARPPAVRDALPDPS
jgi:uncharacterized ferritin-like protein (DUF455 family)